MAFSGIAYPFAPRIALGAILAAVAETAKGAAAAKEDTATKEAAETLTTAIERGGPFYVKAL